MNSKVKLSLVMAAVLLISISYGVFFRLALQSKNNSAEMHTDPVEKLVLGVETSLLPAAVWVAEKKGYFQEQG